MTDKDFDDTPTYYVSNEKTSSFQPDQLTISQETETTSTGLIPLENISDSSEFVSDLNEIQYSSDNSYIKIESFDILVNNSHSSNNEQFPISSKDESINDVLSPLEVGIDFDLQSSSNLAEVPISSSSDNDKNGNIGNMLHVFDNNDVIGANNQSKSIDTLNSDKNTNICNKNDICDSIDNISIHVNEEGNLHETNLVNFIPESTPPIHLEHLPISCEVESSIADKIPIEDCSSHSSNKTVLYVPSYNFDSKSEIVDGIPFIDGISAIESNFNPKESVVNPDESANITSQNEIYDTIDYITDKNDILFVTHSNNDFLLDQTPSIQAEQSPIISEIDSSIEVKEIPNFSPSPDNLSHKIIFLNADSSNDIKNGNITNQDSIGNNAQYIEEIDFNNCKDHKEDVVDPETNNIHANKILSDENNNANISHKNSKNDLIDYSILKISDVPTIASENFSNYDNNYEHSIYNTNSEILPLLKDSNDFQNDLPSNGSKSNASEDENLSIPQKSNLKEAPETSLNIEYVKGLGVDILFENLIYQTLIVKPQNPLLFLNNLTADLIKQENTHFNSSSEKALLAANLFKHNIRIGSDYDVKTSSNVVEHNLDKKSPLNSTKSQTSKSNIMKYSNDSSQSSSSSNKNLTIKNVNSKIKNANPAPSLNKQVMPLSNLKNQNSNTSLTTTINRNSATTATGPNKSTSSLTKSAANFGTSRTTKSIIASSSSKTFTKSNVQTLSNSSSSHSSLPPKSETISKLNDTPSKQSSTSNYSAMNARVKQANVSNVSPDKKITKQPNTSKSNLVSNSISLPSKAINVKSSAISKTNSSAISENKSKNTKLFKTPIKDNGISESSSKQLTSSTRNQNSKTIRSTNSKKNEFNSSKNIIKSSNPLPNSTSRQQANNSLSTSKFPKSNQDSSLSSELILDTKNDGKCINIDSKQIMNESQQPSENEENSCSKIPNQFQSLLNDDTSESDHDYLLAHEDHILNSELSDNLEIPEISQEHISYTSNTHDTTTDNDELYLNDVKNEKFIPDNFAINDLINPFSTTDLEESAHNEGIDLMDEGLLDDSNSISINSLSIIDIQPASVLTLNEMVSNHQSQVIEETIIKEYSQTTITKCDGEDIQSRDNANSLNEEKL